MTQKQFLNISKKQLISLNLNIAIIIIELIALVIYANKRGIKMFRYYSADSNIFTLVICTIYVIYVLKNINKAHIMPPVWLMLLKYMTVCCLSITFIVVLFILAPMHDSNIYYTLLIRNTFIFHHFLCPALLFFTYIFTEGNTILTKKYIFLSLIPTLLYGTIIVILNFNKIIRGPYPFLMVRNQPVYMSVFWALILIILALIVGWGIQKISRKISLKFSKYTISKK